MWCTFTTLRVFPLRWYWVLSSICSFRSHHDVFPLLNNVDGRWRRTDIYRGTISVDDRLFACALRGICGFTCSTFVHYASWWRGISGLILLWRTWLLLLWQSIHLVETRTSLHPCVHISYPVYIRLSDSILSRLRLALPNFPSADQIETILTSLNEEEICKILNL